VTCSTNGVAACSFNVTVQDNQRPAIVCPANITTDAPAGQTSVVVNYLAPSVSDNCPGVTSQCSPPSGSSFAIGTATVTCTATDAAGNTNACSFTILVNETLPEVHDLAIVRLMAPHFVNLKAADPALTKRIRVRIQNRSGHDEVIPSFEVLSNLVTVRLTNLVSGCPAPEVRLILGPPNHVPRTLRPKRAINIFYEATFSVECLPDELKGTGHEDFSCGAVVNHAILDGEADTHPECDVCPRQAVDEPNPDGRITDKGCGAPLGHGLFGDPVLIDLFLKP